MLAPMGEPSEPADPHRLERLLCERAVVVCVGSGGVGKTTVAAALALGAASLGRRTLCLTIDPARRLAQSLGLDAIGTDEIHVSPEWLAQNGVKMSGTLTVMMVDAGRTFDELIDRHAETPARAAAVKQNRIYQHLSRRLAGTQAYMAMEKVQAVVAEGRFDTIVLDTPPSERALDFFDAPERMREVIDSPATRALSRLSQSGGAKLGMRLVNSGVRGLLRGMSRVTGAALLEELGELLAMLNALFGGFAARASDVGARMKSRDFGYVLVTAPQALSLREAEAFARALSQRGLAIESLVVNRMTPDPGAPPELSQLMKSRGFHALGLGPADGPALLEASRVQTEAARADRRDVEELAASTALGHRFEIPDFAEPLHEPKSLLALAERLFGRTPA